MAELIMLRLEGVLQSWGEASAWDNRGTENFPTKSAITGLIACAMGLEREDPEILQLMQSMTIGIRADRPGQAVCDFHTVQGMPNILNAAGKGRGKNGNTIVSHRWYLQDASFLVVIETTEHWKNRILTALNNPRWPVYLGRKSCIPSRPVLECVSCGYETIVQALRSYPVENRAADLLPYEVETELTDGSSLSRTDISAENRKFMRRKVWRGTVRREELCT